MNPLQCTEYRRCNHILCRRCSRHFMSRWIDEGYRRAEESTYERVETISKQEEPDDPSLN